VRKDGREQEGRGRRRREGLNERRMENRTRMITQVSKYESPSKLIINFKWYPNNRSYTET
jgi:hypothetical protein